MFKFESDERSLNSVANTVVKKIGRNLDKALQDIRLDWQQEILRQQRNFHRSLRWRNLTPEYLERKKEDYSNRSQKNVRYVTTLRRSGRMLDGYITNIRIDSSTNRVAMPYPTEYARVHQLGSGGTRAGHGKIPARPFDQERFHEIAKERFGEAVNKGLNE